MKKRNYIWLLLALTSTLLIGCSKKDSAEETMNTNEFGTAVTDTTESKIEKNTSDSVEEKEVITKKLVMKYQNCPLA